MVEKQEIESAFLEMLKEQEQKAPNDEIYKTDMETIGEFQVQWRLP